MRNKKVYINGKPLDEPYVHFLFPPQDGGSSAPDVERRRLRRAALLRPVTVPADQYFMMGDNRDNSQDSRYWGFLPRDYVKGKALFVYFSFGEGGAGQRALVEAAPSDSLMAPRGNGDRHVRTCAGSQAGLKTRLYEPPQRSSAREMFESICVAVILAFFVRTFVVQAFKIPSGSMEPNLLIGDHLLVNKFVSAPTLTGGREDAAADRRRSTAATSSCSSTRRRPSAT